MPYGGALGAHDQGEGPEVEPGDQAEDDPEQPVGRGRAPELVPDHVGAHRLQDLPDHRSRERLRPQRGRRQGTRRQCLEGQHDQRRVDGDRQQHPTAPDPPGDRGPVAVRAGGEGGQHGGDRDAQAQDDQQQQTAQPRDQGIGPLVLRNRPDAVQRVLGRLRHTQRSVQHPADADRQRESAAVQRVDVVAELVPEDRELTERRTQHLRLQPGVAVQGEAEDGDQQQEHREEREEAVVGDQRGQVRALVLDELVDHGDGVARPPVAALIAVESAQHAQARRPVWSQRHPVRPGRLARRPSPRPPLAATRRRRPHAAGPVPARRRGPGRGRHVARRPAGAAGGRRMPPGIRGRRPA